LIGLALHLIVIQAYSGRKTAFPSYRFNRKLLQVNILPRDAVILIARARWYYRVPRFSWRRSNQHLESTRVISTEYVSAEYEMKKLSDATLYVTLVIFQECTWQR
jgi:hypothetical protein